MENNRPVLWWQSAPVIKDGKVLCVAIGRDGEETTSLFTLGEIVAHLTQRPLDFAICAPEYHTLLDEQGDRFCRMCGQPLSQ
jgi:hypothetical protein